MVTCIVQARMGSSRLRGKVLKEVLGIPMILVTLKRLQRSKYIDKLILATSDKSDDDPLYNLVKEAGFEVFRGDESNVLERYVKCVQEYGGDIIVRITGDCPLIEPLIADNVISHFKVYDDDYVKLDVPTTYIRGLDVEVFSKEALTKTYNLTNDPKYTEHVSYYMSVHPEEFKVGTVKGDGLYNRNYRLCVDTPEDFELISVIFDKFNNIHVPIKDVVGFLDANPEIAEINSKINQKEVV